jgi:modulator of FtsH protease HflC
MKLFFNTKLNSLALCLFLVLLFAFNTLTYTVDETEMAVVLKFGKPVSETADPGLHFKMPWPVNSVTFMEKRYFMYDSDPTEVVIEGKRALVTDCFAPIRITDPIKFLQNSLTMEGAQTNTNAQIYSHIRTSLGENVFDDIVINNRESILDSITKMSNPSLEEYALETIMVRFNRVDLPVQNKESVYDRMRKERNQEAQLYRSEGEQESITIKSNTDKEKQEILAAADREQKEIRGKADAEATRIYNVAYGKDPYFFNLLRSLETASLIHGKESGTTTKWMLSGNEPHLKTLLK